MFKSTALIIEILIVGTGFSTWMILLFMTIFGSSMPVAATSSTSSLVVIPVVALLYVFGIIWDRVVDLVSDPLDEKFKLLYFKDSNEYHNAKDIVYAGPEPVKDLFEFTRSRMRIMRSWMIDLLIIGLIVPFHICICTEIDNKIGVSIFISITLLILSIFAFLSWKKLTNTFYKRLHHSHSIQSHPNYKKE